MSEVSTYRVWAADNMVYGPIDPSTVAEWIKEGRVEPETWIYSSSTDNWKEAQQMEQFADLFSKPEGIQRETPSGETNDGNHFDGLTHEHLRQFSIFSSLSDEDLNEFVSFAEVIDMPNDELIVKKGDPGDALFFVLQGQVRVRLIVANSEKTIGHIRAGEFFGEMVMFRQATRSADVVSEGRTRLLRLGSGPFQLLMNNSPTIAVPILYGLGKAMSDRLAADAQRFQQDAATEFLWLRNRLASQEQEA